MEERRGSVGLPTYSRAAIDPNLIPDKEQKNGNKIKSTVRAKY